MSRDDRPGPIPREGRGSLGDVDEAGRVGRRVVYEGRIVKLSVDTVRFPGGETGTLELVRHPGAAAVVPFLDSPGEADPRILLLHQYRYAADGPLYEVPAGLPDSPQEAWEACARRELAEETGYRARELRYLTRIYTTPGFTDEVIHLFAAAGLSPGAADRDRDEFLDLVPLPFSRVLAGIREGRIVDGKSVSALLFVHAFRERIWSETRVPPERRPGP